MAKLLIAVLIVCAVINPAWFEELYEALTQNPLIFLLGALLGLAVGLAWNRKELSAKDERIKAKDDKIGDLTGRLSDSKTQLKDCQVRLNRYEPDQPITYNN